MGAMQTDLLPWTETDDPSAIRVALERERRELETLHGPLLGTRFDSHLERLEEYYADGTMFARRLKAAAAELAFEVH